MIISRSLVTNRPDTQLNRPALSPRQPSAVTKLPFGLYIRTLAFPPSPTRMNPLGSTAITSGYWNCPITDPTCPNSSIFSPCLLKILTLRLPLSSTKTLSSWTATPIGHLRSTYRVGVLVCDAFNSWSFGIRPNCDSIRPFVGLTHWNDIYRLRNSWCICYSNPLCCSLG